MSAQRSPTPTERRSPGKQRRGTKSPQRINRAQQRAMEARAAVTVAPSEEAPEESFVVTSGTGAATMGRRTTALGKRRAVARPAVLSRDQEYRFIRADLRRMLLTAGVLLVMMIALLLLVD